MKTIIGSPILSMDGKRVVSYWSAGVELLHGNAFSFSWFSPSSHEDIISGPEMIRDHEGDRELANKAVVAMDYSSGPIQVWRVVEMRGDANEAFVGNSWFSSVDMSDDARLADAILLVLASNINFGFDLSVIDIMKYHAEGLTMK